MIDLSLCDETISFLLFVGIGMLFSIIFDFFRAIRKFTKTKSQLVYIQDIIYFVLIGIILLVAILNIRRDIFRLYLILAIILGITIYISVIGNKIMKLLVYMLKTSCLVTNFVFLPIKVYSTIFDKQTRKIKKYVVDCCKKISYMIEFYHKIVSKVANTNKNKRKKRKI